MKVTMPETGLHNVSEQCPVDALHDIDFPVADDGFAVPVDQAGYDRSSLPWMVFGLESAQGAREIGDRRASGILFSGSEFAMVFRSRAHDPDLAVARDMTSSLDIRSGGMEGFRRNAARMLRLKPHPDPTASTLQEHGSSRSSRGKSSCGIRRHSRLISRSAVAVPGFPRGSEPGSGAFTEGREPQPPSSRRTGPEQ